MTEEHLTPEQARARDVVRSLGEPPVSEDFRARLKDRFVHGEIPGSGSAGSDGAGRTRVFRMRRPVLAALPLAAVLGMALVGLMNRGPAWEVEAVTGEGTITVDGEAVAAADADRLDALLEPGAMIMIPEGVEVNLMAPGVCGMQLTSGTSMTLPASPGRWFGRKRDCRLEMGEVRITTGADFAGSRLHVMTDEAKVEVRGTTLAVIRDGTSTCVCVYSGSVGMSEVAMPPEPVEQGMRKVMYSDPSMEPTVEPLQPMEEMKLRMFEDAAGPKLGSHASK